MYFEYRRWQVQTGQFQSLQSCVNPLDKSIRFKVKSFAERPTNAGFRDALTTGLIVPGLKPEELKSRYKDLVWWEKDLAQEKSSSWRL
jgi:hypothetical protein